MSKNRFLIHSFNDVCGSYYGPYISSNE